MDHRNLSGGLSARDCVRATITAEAFYLHTYLDVFNRILADNFGCIQSIIIGPIGINHSDRSQIPALDAMVLISGLVDAQVLRDHADDD